MNKSNSKRSVLSRLLPATIGLILLVGLAIVMFSQLMPSGNMTPTVSAQSREGKVYIGTKAVIMDKITGEARKPTREEAKEMVDSLRSLTKRTIDNPKPIKLASGATALSLDGAFQGVMLARAGDGANMEMRCVFTFEEGVEFLGLVEESSNK